MGKKVWWAIGAGAVGGFIVSAILGWVRYAIQLLLAIYAPSGVYSVFAVSPLGITASFIVGLLPFVFAGLAAIWQYKRLSKKVR